jgi:hypothetical protein
MEYVNYLILYIKKQYVACKYCLRITYIFIVKRTCNRDNSNIKKIQWCHIALDYLGYVPKHLYDLQLCATMTAHSQEHIHSSYTAGSCLG